MFYDYFEFDESSGCNDSDVTGVTVNCHILDVYSPRKLPLKQEQENVVGEKDPTGIGPIAVCLTANSTLFSVLNAQQYNPPAPRLFQPRARAVSGRFAQRMVRPTVATSPVMAIQEGQPMETIQGESFVEGTEIRSIPGEEIILDDGAYFEEGAYIEGGYDDCGGCGGHGCFECGPAVDPRDCTLPDDCWIGGLGGLLCNTEFFTGVQGFRNQVFSEQSIPTRHTGNFGFHAGFNTGLPLYKLTCGLVSGQVGFNFVGSNYRSNDLFTGGDRRQTFFTAGLFRRVDYGLQFGAVADVLHEEYLTDRDVVQIRSELSYVWPIGHSVGFRFAKNVQDAQGNFGEFLPEINAQSINWYNLFLRRACSHGGYCDFYLGRSDRTTHHYRVKIRPAAGIQNRPANRIHLHDSGQ